jgi:hypothetical protein
VFELALTRCFEVPVLRGAAGLTLTKAIVRTNQGGAAVFGTGTPRRWAPSIAAKDGFPAGHRFLMPEAAKAPLADRDAAPHGWRPQARSALGLELPSAAVVLTMRERCSSQVCREGNPDARYAAPDIRKMGRPGARTGSRDYRDAPVTRKGLRR